MEDKCNIQIINVKPHYEQDRIEYITINYELNGVYDTLDVEIDKESNKTNIYTANVSLLKMKKDISKSVILDIIVKALHWKK